MSTSSPPPLTYKEEKEAWVSNCTGGFVFEVFAIASSCVLSHWFYLTLAKFNLINSNSFICQLFIYVVPSLLLQTIFSNHILQVLSGMVFLTVNILYKTMKEDPSITRLQEALKQKKNNKTSTTTERENKSKENDDDKKKSATSTVSTYKTYLTVYRGATMLLTCIAILAVDFPVFPRRFAKVETFGTSLMDIGVGSFVFSSGIIASKSVSNSLQQLNMKSRFWQAVKSSIPLLFLGLSRLVLTRGVDYQVHSSEYGLHWNFFITLGLLPPLVTLATWLKKSSYQHIQFSYFGWMIGVSYQYVLLGYGLQHWILEAPRVSLLSANKEGICSLIGYLAIFLFGIDTGNILFNAIDNYKVIGVKLSVRSLFYWVALGLWNLILKDEQYHVSRRLCNLPYIVWVVSFNLTLITALIWIEYKMDGQKVEPPRLLTYINLNGLATFLLANVLTGLINLSMKTLYASSIESIVVLLIYMTLVSLFPWILWDAFQIRIRL
ncbi:unnamed protein product [Cunninghamella blakesleeana]